MDEHSGMLGRSQRRHVRLIGLVPMDPRSRMSPAHRGFSLVELMIALAIFAMLVVASVPMYGQFVANTQIRTATESMLTGVRLAQTEAVKRNGTVEFLLDPATGWTVNDVSDPNNVATIRTESFVTGSKQTTVTAANALSRVTFSGLGRIFPKNPVDNTNPLAQIDVTTSTNVSGPRNLRLVIGTAYGIKVCDPGRASTDPAGCP